RAFYQGVCDSFTAIRQSRRVGDPEPREDIPSGGPGRGVSHTLDGLVRTARRIVHHPRTSLSRLRRERAEFKVSRIHASVEQAYRAGYDFHQHAVEQSDVMLAWVLKEDYWDLCTARSEVTADTKQCRTGKTLYVERSVRVASRLRRLGY